MEIIAKISKGSKMDQIYIPKQRAILNIGEYAIIKPLHPEILEKQKSERLYFYGIKGLGPVKLSIIKDVINIADKNIKSKNIIITGSFLDKGFNFNDIDIIIISENSIKASFIKKDMEIKLGIEAHIINLDSKSLSKGLKTDPLYRTMLSRCVAVKRLAPIKKQEINYKILDLHLLKSKLLIDNFDVLNGKEKYGLVRNLIAIYLFLKKSKISAEKINAKITSLLKLSAKEIKQNMIDKKHFIEKYKKIYNETYNKTLEGIKNESKQE